MWIYLVVFLASCLVDLIPVIGPPAWSVMIFFQVKFDLNVWLVLAFGIPGSTLGRYLMSLYVPEVADKIIKRRKNQELAFLGEKLGQSLGRTWLFVFAYTLTPLSTTALFTAAAIARIPPVHLIPPFFVGKFISDTFIVLSGKQFAAHAGGLVHGSVNWKTASISIVGLLVIGGLLFVDWRALLQHK